MHFYGKLLILRKTVDFTDENLDISPNEWLSLINGPSLFTFRLSLFSATRFSAKSARSQLGVNGGKLGSTFINNLSIMSLITVNHADPPAVALVRGSEPEFTKVDH